MNLIESLTAYKSNLLECIRFRRLEKRKIMTQPCSISDLKRYLPWKRVRNRAFWNLKSANSKEISVLNMHNFILSNSLFSFLKPNSRIATRRHNRISQVYLVFRHMKKQKRCGISFATVLLDHLVLNFSNFFTTWWLLLLDLNS